jgi:hypothetical protein
VDECPIEFFENVDTCTGCHHSCEECSGGEENQCTKCREDYFYYAKTQLCTPLCPPKTLANDETMTCTGKTLAYETA